MKKFVKIAAIVVAVILAVALIVPFALRGKIADIVKREANAMLAARLDFEKLDISLLRHFPNASVELKGLTLVGVDRFEGDTIVAARRFGDSGFEVTKVILASPAVHTHKLADGAVSWDVMKPSEAPAEEVPAEEPAPSSFRLSVRDFRISDAAIRYEDDSTNMRFSTAPLSLRLRGNMSADRTDLDVSTISRVVNSKYVQTQFGIILLKSLFSEAMQTESGEEVSSYEIKNILQECIDNEDKRHPLTDEMLMDILNDKGYCIARRTVAKYREMLNIPVARLRKQI